MHPVTDIGNKRERPRTKRGDTRLEGEPEARETTGTLSVWEKGLVVGVGVLRVGKAFFGRDSQPVDTAHTDNQYMCL